MRCGLSPFSAAAPFTSLQGSAASTVPFPADFVRFPLLRRLFRPKRPKQNIVPQRVRNALGDFVYASYMIFAPLKAFPFEGKVVRQNRMRCYCEQLC